MKKVVSIAVILFSFNLFGAEKVTLNDALNIAYENNYEFKNVKLDQENSELQVKEGYKGLGPSLDYRGGYTVYDKTTPGLKSDQRFNHVFSIKQPLYNGGMVTSGIKIANMSKELTTYNVEKQKSKLKLDVIDKYLKILAQEEKIKVYDSTLKEVEEASKRAKRKYELKVISKADYLPLKTKVISKNSDLVAAQNQEKILKLQFKNMIGLSSDQEIDLKSLEIQKYDISVIDVDSDIHYALLNNNETRISQINTNIIEEKEAISRADLLPKVNANLSYSANDRHLANSADQWYWTAGVEVNWKIFDFGRSWDAYSRSKNETKKSINRESQVKNNLAVKIRSNYISLVKLNGMYETKKAELEATQENYDLQKKKYNSGLISITDYLTYETQLDNIKLSIITTKLNYYYAYEKYLEELK